MGWAAKNDYILVDREMEIYCLPQKSSEVSRGRKNRQGFLAKINFFFKKDDPREFQEIEFYKRLAQKEKSNARIHLKLADLYQRRGEHKKAISAYLRAAEIFSENGLLSQALALYKRILKEEPQLEEVNWKIAEIYGKMGFLADAFRHYNRLLNQYEITGSKEKIQEILKLLVNLDPQKFMLDRERGDNTFDGGSIKSAAQGAKREEDESCASTFFDLGAALLKSEPVIFSYEAEVQTDKDIGFGQVIKELCKNEEDKQIYPHFYFHLGVACWEMGFMDEAIEYLQESLRRAECVFKAARMLARCYKEKGWWKEAQEYLNLALKMEEVTEEKKEELEKELNFVKNEQAREKQILGMLNTDNKLKSERRKKNMESGLFGDGLKIEGALPA